MISTRNADQEEFPLIQGIFFFIFYIQCVFLDMGNSKLKFSDKLCCLKNSQVNILCESGISEYSWSD